MDGTNFLWTEDEAREMFQDHRMWPAFIGARQEDLKKESVGALPVLIWTEQQKYLEKKNKKDSPPCGKVVEIPRVEIEESVLRKRKFSAEGDCPQHDVNEGDVIH